MFIYFLLGFVLGPIISTQCAFVLLQGERFRQVASIQERAFASGQPHLPDVLLQQRLALSQQRASSSMHTRSISIHTHLQCVHFLIILCQSTQREKSSTPGLKPGTPMSQDSSTPGPSGPPQFRPVPGKAGVDPLGKSQIALVCWCEE